MDGYQDPSYHRGWHDGFMAGSGSAEAPTEAVEVIAQRLAERFGDVMWADMPAFAQETWRWEAKDVLAGLVIPLQTPKTPSRRAIPLEMASAYETKANGA